MNTLILVAFALVALCYCGGKYCPSLLKQNKEMALGVLVGIFLCSFMDLRIEGFDDIQLMAWESNDCCNNQTSPKCKNLITEVNDSGDMINTASIIHKNCSPSVPPAPSAPSAPPSKP